jgi:hypothetical protein
MFDGAAFTATLTQLAMPVTVVTATGGMSVVMQMQTVAKATIPGGMFVAPRVTSVAVRNIGPGGSITSAAQSFSVGTPAPTLTSLGGVPVPLLVDNPGFTLIVSGTGFIPGTSIVVQGTPITTAFISDTQLSGFVPPSLLISGGTLAVTALKPQPTIGPSNALTMTLTSPLPGVTSIAPSFAETRLTEDAQPLQITVKGFGFVKGSIIQIDKNDVQTTYVSSSQLTGSLAQPQIEKARVALITVKNPDPVVSTFHFDSPMPLSLYNPVPTVTSLDASALLFDPNPRFEGDTPQFPAQVVIHGTNFVKDGLIYVYGTPCDDLAGGFAGQRISSTVIVGSVTIACTGLYRIGVVNPQPGGGISTLLSFTVSDYSAPSPVVVGGLSPAAVSANSGSFDLTISGANFSAGAVVNFGAAVLLPNLVTTNAIIVNVPGYLVKSSGTIPVSVTNPDLTGNSNRILFTVN